MITVPKMPFYWRFRDNPELGQNDLPARVPFGFDYDPALDLFIETRSPELSALLAEIYSRHANVGFLQDGHSLVNTYGADFWGFLVRLLEEHPVQNVLEVGCGGCVLLERLRDQGCKVVGVDPSPFAAQAGEAKGIEVLQEFFPPQRLDFTPDLIFQVDVLEHIEDPLTFLKSEVECVRNGGMIVINVPDCSQSLARGDISMALHQHVNMFDMESMANLIQAAGLEMIKLEKSRYGSALYCAARKTPGLKTAAPVRDPGRFERFEAQASKNIGSFKTALAQARAAGDSIGFFMPQRAFPYLGMIDWFDGFRVFDNLNLWHKRYLDGLDVAIENQADLLKNPVDHIFIMSLTFGAEVAGQLRRDLPDMKITTLDDILARAL
jgi:SAM-dependent methyltransferase